MVRTGFRSSRSISSSFAQRDLWPGYGSNENDRVYVDVYEHWLEAE